MNGGAISKVSGHAFGHSPKPKTSKTQKTSKTPKTPKTPENLEHTFTIIDAIYYNSTEEGRPIAGVPEYGKSTFGIYTGKYPYVAASKAFSNLQKHMKKFSKDWFPDYDNEDPPAIVFLLRRLSDAKVFAYQGRRKVAPQSQDGPRVVKSGGRVRIYRWVNDIQALDVEDTAEELS